MDAATKALLQAKDVFGSRVYADRATPFDPGTSTRVLPAVCLYLPNFKFSTEGRALSRGTFFFSSFDMLLEVWARVPSGKFQSTEEHEKAQAKALRLAVQNVIDTLFSSNELLSLCSHVPKLEIRYGQDVTTQTRVDAATIIITFAEQNGNVSCRARATSVPLKSLFLDVDIPTDPNAAPAVHARYLDLDKE